MARINLLPWRENLRQSASATSWWRWVHCSRRDRLVLIGNHLMNRQISGQDTATAIWSRRSAKLDRDIQRIEQLEEQRRGHAGAQDRDRAACRRTVR
jgi:Tfp pilus assembly protein PilN